MTSSGRLLARGVHAVGDHDHRAPALAVAGQVARRLVERVVQGGGAEGLDLSKASLAPSPGRVVNATTPQYRLSKPARPPRPPAPGRPGSGTRHARAGGLELAAHAPAGVHQEQDAGAESRARREVLDPLRAAVLEDAELLAPQVRDRPAFRRRPWRRGRPGRLLDGEREHLPLARGRERDQRQRRTSTVLSPEPSGRLSEAISIPGSSRAGVIQITPTRLCRCKAVYLEDLDHDQGDVVGGVGRAKERPRIGDQVLADLRRRRSAAASNRGRAAQPRTPPARCRASITPSVWKTKTSPGASSTPSSS